MEYQARSEKNLRERREKCVCKMCGGRLEIRLIIHNQYGGQGLDLYCPHCDRVEYGVEPKIYQIAKTFVERFEFNYFTDMEENNRNTQLNIAKVCDIVSCVKKFENEQK